MATAIELAWSAGAYPAEIVRWVDGDTVDARVDLGFTVQVLTRFRLEDIDTPELRSPDPDERVRARIATQRCEELAPAGSRAFIRSSKGDKYGRWLGRVFLADGRDIGAILVEEGHAVVYDGGRRG